VPLRSSNDGCKLRIELVVAATNEDAVEQGDNHAAAIVLVDPVLTQDDEDFLGTPPVILPPPAPAPSRSPFEFRDGNLVVNTAGNRDWANAPDPSHADAESVEIGTEFLGLAGPLRMARMTCVHGMISSTFTAP
jgi:hypothetical protein